MKYNSPISPIKLSQEQIVVRVMHVLLPFENNLSFTSVLIVFLEQMTHVAWKS